MKLHFSPQRSDAQLTVTVIGDVLNVNGTDFDFSQLPEGATLPADAVDSEWFCGPISRVAGELQLHLLLPHGASPAPAVAFPTPLVVTGDGPVELPQ